MIEAADTPSQFAALVKAYHFVLVDFWAPWCGPCKSMGKLIEDVCSSINGDIAVVKVNTQNMDMRGLAKSYPFAGGIHAIPTLAFMKDGTLVDHEIYKGDPAGMCIGLCDKAWLVDTLRREGFCNS